MQTLVQTALLTLLFSTTFAADFPVAQAHITTAPPRIDGALNDSAWSEAVPVSGFLQREPDEGAPASERTEVHILRDDDNLYLGFRCFDRIAISALGLGCYRIFSVRQIDHWEKLLISVSLTKMIGK